MRNSKRILALALALLMVVGMFSNVMAASVSADDIKDFDKIDERYQTAVGVLLGAEIVAGRETGNFDPADTVNRAEMAKMLFVMFNGYDNASAFATGSSKYKDVQIGSWYEGYVNWATQVGVLKGDGDGNVRPAAAVTVAEAAAMLLRAVGYDANGELTGLGWDVATATLASEKGVLDVVKDSQMNVNAAASRQVAAQMVFNTMTKVKLVTYNQYLGYQTTTTAGTTFGKQTFNLAISDKAEDVTTMGEKKDQMISGNGSTTYTYTPDKGDIGRKVVFYGGRVDGKNVILYAEKVSTDIVIAPGTKEDDFNKAIKGYTLTETAVAVYKNGTDTTKKLSELTPDEKKAMNLQNVTYVGYEGKIIAVVYEETLIVDVTTDRNSDVTVNGGTPVKAADVKDKIVYTGDQDLTAARAKYVMECSIVDGVYYLSDVTTITGVVTASRNNTLTVDGKTYDYDGSYVLNKSTEVSFTWNNNYKDTYNFYVSSVDNTIYASELVDGTTASDLLYVTRVGAIKGSFENVEGYSVEFVDAKGQTHTETTKKDAPAANDLVVAYEQSNGTYNFKKATDVGYTVVDADIATKDAEVDQIVIKDAFKKAVSTVLGEDVYVGANTTVVYVDVNKYKDHEVMTGTHESTAKGKLVESGSAMVDTKLYIVNNKSGTAEIVFVGATLSDGATNTSNVFFYAGDGHSYNGDVYSYELYSVDGGVKTVTAKEPISNADDAGFVKQTMNGIERITASDNDKIVTGTITKDPATPVSGGYAYDTFVVDADAYVINAKEIKEIKEIDANKLVTNDEYMAYMNSNGTRAIFVAVID